MRRNPQYKIHHFDPFCGDIMRKWATNMTWRAAPHDFVPMEIAPGHLCPIHIFSWLDATPVAKDSNTKQSKLDQEIFTPHDKTHFLSIPYTYRGFIIGFHQKTWVVKLRFMEYQLGHAKMDFFWYWITGWWFQPLWKILVRRDDYSQLNGKMKFMFQTTNQTSH